MKLKHHLIILWVVCVPDIFAQNNTAPGNLNEKELYAFMQIVITQRMLNKTYGLSIKPDTSFQYHTLDHAFLSKYLFDSVAIKKRLRFDSIQHQKPFNSLRELNLYIDDETKCLSENDIRSFLKNKKTDPGFKWQTSELGFSLNNEKEWYSFTLPVFNSDNTMALICIIYTCDLFLCGNGDVILFKKKNNEWTNVTLSHWNN